MVKEKPDISIKKSNVGKFTSYCKSKGYESVTHECEQEGLASKSAGVRKMANFSRNARKWSKK